MSMTNIRIVINFIFFMFSLFISFNSISDTKVINLTINQSTLKDVNKLYETERKGDLGYKLDPSKVPIQDVVEASVVIYEGKLKVVSFTFYDSKYSYLNELLKSKYKLISEENNVVSKLTTFENDGDMIFLKSNGGKYIELIYVNKEYNILVNKSVNKRKEKERDNDFGHL